jgi:hypothetical protein
MFTVEEASEKIGVSYRHTKQIQKAVAEWSQGRGGGLRTLLKVLKMAIS